MEEKELKETSTKEEVKTKVEDKPKEEIRDIDLSSTSKAKFRIDNDSSRILELNTSDFGIADRLQKFYPKLNKLQAKFDALGKLTDSEDDLKKMGEMVVELDSTMRGYMDELFDSEVSKVCAPSGTMFDPINGQMRWEHIISVLCGLYEKDINKEISKIKNRVSKHTNKYVK